MTRSVGVEEELLVIDPRTWAATSRAREVLKEHADREATGALDSELYRHQLEIRTEPTTDIDDLVSQVVAARRTASESAAARDLAVAACATVPLGVDEPKVTSDDRYRAIVETFGEGARLGTTCGMHVHVAIDSDEEGVGCLDRMAPWLPVLLAMSTNSPFSVGRDTAYASWRTQLWSNWPSAGPAEAFGSAAGYRRAGDRMIASGAARDRQDALLGRPPVGGTSDPGGAGPRRGHRRPGRRAAGRAGPWTRRDDGRSSGRLTRDRSRGGARSSARRGGGPRATAWPVSWSTLGRMSCERPARWSRRWSTWSRTASLRRATPISSRPGLDRIRGGTGAVRQRAAYERTGSVEGVVADLVTRTAEAWA